jgi:chromosomal replication initiation ATPase DnaA
MHPAADFPLATKTAQRAIKPLAPRGGADEGCKLAVLLVADALQLKLSDILAVTRGSPADAHARQAAMYLAHVALGISLTAIGRFFARDHSTVAHGCRCVEDRRDDPAFDTMIAELALAARLALHLDCEVTA